MTGDDDYSKIEKLLGNGWVTDDISMKEFLELVDTTEEDFESRLKGRPIFSQRIREKYK